MKQIYKVISFSLISLMLSFSLANASSGVFKLSHDLGFGKDTNLDAITKGRLFQVVIMTQNRLVRKDLKGKVSASLATKWSANSEATEWTFNLRKGIKFHDGSDFDAEDVKYSLMRVKDPDIGSPAKKSMSSVTDIEVVDSHTVKMKLSTSFADFPLLLTDYRLRMIPSGSGDTIGQTGVGTGPFKVETFDPEGTTVLKANPNYWGKNIYPTEVSEIIYTPIQSAATRVAALLSGQVDIIQDVPVQDLERVRSTDGLKVATTAQNRVIFFGLDTTEGPTSKLKVRQAMNIAINRDAIKKVVMRGQSDPTGVIMPPFVNGWTEALNKYPAYDLANAKSLMSEAGYDNGFSITLNCPNDRYVNDEAICQSAVGMMAKIGIEVTLDAKPKAQHFPIAKGGESDFYMLGWGVPTFDSHYIFNYLVHTQTDKRGSWNPTGFSNSNVDNMIVSLESETDLKARDGTIAKIWEAVQESQMYLPIHNQVLNWGMTNNIEFDVQPEDQPHFQFLSFK